MTALRSFHEQYRIELRIRCTTQVWTVAWGHTAFDGVTETGQSVATDDQHIGHAPVLELGDNPEPELGAFVAFAEPEAQNMFVAVDIDGHCDIDGPVHHDVIGADFDNDRIQIQDRIHRVEVG